MGRQSEYDEKNRFNNEKGNRTRLPSEFFYNKIRLKEYNSRGKNDELVIYANYDYGSNLYQFTERIECKNSGLLCEILKLKEDLSIELFEPKHMTFCDIDVNDEDKNHIIKWCTRNGFPFKVGFENSPESKPLFKLPNQAHQIGFKVWDFIRQLNDVYSSYLLYRVITDKELPSFETMAYISREPVKDGADLIEGKFKLLQGMSKKDCRSVFESKYQEITFTNQISFGYEIHLTVKTENLFDATFYQLALLLNGAEKEIGKCPLCNSYFERQHARQKYCLTENEYGIRTCYSQKKYKREKLEQKKNG